MAKASYSHPFNKLRILHYLFICFLIAPICAMAQNEPFEYVERVLGGEDINGELYQKRYGGQGDYSPLYNHWKGYEVQSNEEIEDLLKTNPAIEALKITLWNGDTTKGPALTKRIGEFTNLKFLEINSNRIVSYPKQIEKLVNLEELVLQIKGRKKIEFKFSSFIKLRHLTIHFADDLLEFPNSIFDLANLESLKLFRFFSVKSQELKGIEKLKKLQELYIWDSKLRLPDTFFDFPELKTLILDRYQWKLPEATWNQVSLKRLTLNGFFAPIDLTKISKLKNLEVLYLEYHTQFISRFELPKLKHLYIFESGDKIFSLTAHDLPELESIVFWNARELKELTLDSRNHLRSIKLIENKSLESLTCIGTFSQLEEYFLRDNQALKSYPEMINGIVAKSDLN